jgi:phage gp46-like protein
MSQQGDVLLFQTTDGGDVIIENGMMEMTGSFETALYLSLYGGNEDDDGTPTNNWWGNIDETEPSKEYHSNTQHIIDGLPASSANLRRLEDAMLVDLAWFEDEGIANEITSSARISTLHHVDLSATITAEGVETSFQFTDNWKASR